MDDIYSRWFDFGEDASVNTRNLQNMCVLTEEDTPGVLHISEGDYPIEVNNERASCIVPYSNTSIILDGKLLLQPNNLSRYSIVEISNKHNVSISGCGCIVGDVQNHMGTEGEWGMGVSIKTSRNIKIQSITVRNCWGDCIYIGQTKIAKDDFSENVLIEHVTCDSGRRQGLSLIAGKNIHIKDSKFINTGKIKYTAPGRGIDIEPNNKDNTVVQDILIKECSFTGNYKNNDFLTYNLNHDASIRVARCKMDGNVSFYQNSYNVVFDSCEVRSLDFVDSDISNNVVRNTVFNKVRPNTTAPEKVKFDNCEYPQNKVSGFTPIPNKYKFFF